MNIEPLLPLLQSPPPPLHPDGLGWDEFLPGVLAVLIGMGVYMVIQGGGDGEAARDSKLTDSGEGEAARSARRSRRRNNQR